MFSFVVFNQQSWLWKFDSNDERSNLKQRHCDKWNFFYYTWTMYIRRGIIRDRYNKQVCTFCFLHSIYLVRRSVGFWYFKISTLSVFLKSKIWTVSEWVQIYADYSNSIETLCLEQKGADTILKDKVIFWKVFDLICFISPIAQWQYHVPCHVEAHIPPQPITTF